MVRAKERNELINKIKNIDDKQVLDEINRLLNINLDESTYSLNSEQREALSISRKMIKLGKGIPSAIANEEVNKWLEK